MNRRKNRNLVIAIVGTWSWSNITITVKALHYGHAAQRDERNGCPYTAAIEWRKAAELFLSTRAAEYCWRQWERIMRLPRRLAGPVSVSSVLTFPAAATRPVMVPVTGQSSFATAA